MYLTSYYILITSHHSGLLKDHKTNEMHHKLIHLNSKSTKNPYFVYIVSVQCEKFTGNKIPPSWYISAHIFALIYHLDLVEDIQYLIGIIMNNFTNFQVHTAINFSLILIFWYIGRSFSIGLSNFGGLCNYIQP